MEGLSSLVQQESEGHEGADNVVAEHWPEKELLVFVNPSETRRPPAKLWWGCPCIKGMMDGPCKEEFKGMLTCWENSTAEDQGADCIPVMFKLTQCMNDNGEEF